MDQITQPTPMTMGQSEEARIALGALVDALRSVDDACERVEQLGIAPYLPRVFEGMFVQARMEELRDEVGGYFIETGGEKAEHTGLAALLAYLDALLQPGVSDFTCANDDMEPYSAVRELWGLTPLVRCYVCAGAMDQQYGRVCPSCAQELAAYATQNQLELVKHDRQYRSRGADGGGHSVATIVPPALAGVAAGFYEVQSDAAHAHFYDPRTNYDCY